MDTNRYRLYEILTNLPMFQYAPRTYFQANIKMILNHIFEQWKSGICIQPDIRLPSSKLVVYVYLFLTWSWM